MFGPSAVHPRPKSTPNLPEDDLGVISVAGVILWPLTTVFHVSFGFVIGTPPAGGPGERPDYHLPLEIGVFWIDSGPDPEVIDLECLSWP